MMKKNFTFLALAALSLAAFTFTGCKDDPEPVKVSSITVAPASVTLEIGGTQALTATVSPSDAADTSYIWSSSDDSKASVSSSGVVTAKAEGTVTITATANDGSNAKGTSTVTVNAAPAEPAATITPGAGFAASGKTTVLYSGALNEAGAPAVDLSVGLGVVYSFGSIKLKLTTDNEVINGVLATNGLAEGFDLLALTPDQQTALGTLMPGLVPSGSPGKSISLGFSGILPMVVQAVPGGIGQFDIEVEVTDAVGTVTPAPQNALATLKKTFELVFVDDISVRLTATDNLNLDEVNTVTYTYIANGEGGGPVPTAITVASAAGISSLKLTLTTDNDGLSTILESMSLTGEFDLGAPTPMQTFGLGMIGFPTGENVIEKNSVTLPLNQLFGVIAAQIKGGINQFDIAIAATDANGAELIPAGLLKLKFVDDVTFEITGDGIGAERLEIIASEAMGETPVPVAVDIFAGAGIDKFEVEITSSSEIFTGGLAALGLGSKFDIANPTEEIIEALNNPMITNIGGLPYGEAVKGKNEMMFDITGFIPMIFGLRMQGGETGDCTADFKLTVTDKHGVAKTATIKLDLVDDATPPAEGGE